MPIPQNSEHSHQLVLLKVNKRIVPGVTGVLKPPLPLLRGTKGLAGDLPVEQVGFFLFSPVSFNADILIGLTHSLHFPQSLIQVIVMEIVEGIQRDH